MHPMHFVSDSKTRVFTQKYTPGRPDSAKVPIFCFMCLLYGLGFFVFFFGACSILRQKDAKEKRR